MSREKDIKKLIALYTRRLQKLKEQEAVKGMDAPPQILIEIEDIETKIEALQDTLAVMASESSFQTTPTIDIAAELARLEQLEQTKPSKSGPAFNMQGASVKAAVVNQGGQQTFNAPINVDMRETSTQVEVGRTYAAGDQFSSDFRGAMVNVQSHLDQVIQTIGTLATAQPEKEQLIALIEQLKQQLAQVPAEQSKAAEKVTKRVKALAEELDSEEPDKEMIEITASSFEQAAKNLANVIPTVLPIVTQIVAHVLKLTG